MNRRATIKEKQMANCTYCGCPDTAHWQSPYDKKEACHSEDCDCKELKTVKKGK
jgi:hypothetical protein